jgi:hypothetical protein
VARFACSGNVADIVGSIGAVTFQGGPSGSIVRSRGRRGARVSDAQRERVCWLGAAVAAWGKLSGADRRAWETWVSAGNRWGAGEIGRTGDARSQFLGLWMFEQKVLGGQLTGLPKSGGIRGPESVGLVGSESGGSLVLSWTPTPLGAGEVAVLRVGVVRSEGSSVLERGWIGPFGLGGGAESPIDLGPAVNAYAGLVRAGRVIVVRLAVYTATHRRLSGELQARAVIGA